MLDFVRALVKLTKDASIVYPDFKVRRSNDLMIRGSSFYAIWDKEAGLWSTDEFRAIELIDAIIEEKVNAIQASGVEAKGLYLSSSNSRSIDLWTKYCKKQCPDNYRDLDSELVFMSDPPDRKKYATHRLPYDLVPAPTPNYDELVSVLYSPEERHKIEWAIGAIITGDSKTLQKFMVLYGSSGTGKSTIINIINKLFDGYSSMFDSAALGSSTAQFALEAFKNNPLVAYEHDGDLSRLDTNIRLNSVVSHEPMLVNEKFKAKYKLRPHSFLIMGTNKPVKITDKKSGLLRRLIDVYPTGETVPVNRYNELYSAIDFELGGIASHCRDVYLNDPKYYKDYIAHNMMEETNVFYNFVEENALLFQKQDGTTLKQAWELYKEYIEDSKIQYPMNKMVFKAELKTYFKVYMDDTTRGGMRIYGAYTGFKWRKIPGLKNLENVSEDEAVDTPDWLSFEPLDGPSAFDILAQTYPAQYANSEGTPTKKWSDVTTVLGGLDTHRLHYVKVPIEHIVIDFDLKDASGQKSLALNIEAAKTWPATYAELSKSGQGIHLHYIYRGDPERLSRIYAPDIEIKVFKGNSSLRRQLSRYNALDISDISSGLPLKEEKAVINKDMVLNEKAIRTTILRNLNKEYHANTTQSVSFIKKVLDDAYESGMDYDVSDMRNAVLVFAGNSTHQSEKCVKMVAKMHFKSDKELEGAPASKDTIIFFDVEVFPNLFVVCWKAKDDPTIISWIDPTPKDIEQLLEYKLVGFNNRRYDNHILYARLLGYSNEQLFALSQRIIDSPKGTKDNGTFSNAYNLSYTDIYDYSSKKQSLKKWEIELGIHHQELGLPWDEPVPDDMKALVADYCKNDVAATEAVWNATQGDFTAREILAEICDSDVNATTNSLTTKIIFGNEKHPKLIYTDLSETFPGYEFKDGKNLYRGTDIGKGGYIISWAGIYENVALLDLSAMHPSSIRAMNCFGDHTKNFTDIVDTRLAIKHGDFDSARKMMNGKFAKFLNDKDQAKQLSKALKISVNSVYGLTAANFDNPFRDVRNKNNIVALRGALFMRTLQDEVTERGFDIVAIKTDSMKIVNATKDIIDYCFKRASDYGYSFEFEAAYERICQINDADYVAKVMSVADCEARYGFIPDVNKEEEGQWTVTGRRFAIPYVFKTLFTHEPIRFEDLTVTFEVKTALYLDMNEDNPDKHNYIFVGKVGLFCPMKKGGGLLLRKADTDKYSFATGAKDYRWLEAEYVRANHLEDDIDISYFNKLANGAVEEIEKYGNFDEFVEGEAPWFAPDGSQIDIFEEVKK